jgi:hypothetical protein
MSMMQAVKGSVSLFKQEQALGFSSISTNTRMTVIKLQSAASGCTPPSLPPKNASRYYTSVSATNTLAHLQ